MKSLLVAIFSLMVAAAGWFYMFYSTAADRLRGIEQPRINRKRVLLRRVGGLSMFLLAICFFAAFYAIDGWKPKRFALLVMTVLVLLCIILVLGLIDLRLTLKLRKRNDDL